MQYYEWMPEALEWQTVILWTRVLLKDILPEITKPGLKDTISI
jgi:hypothetical protein